MNSAPVPPWMSTPQASDADLDRVSQLGPLRHGDALIGTTCLYCYKSIMVGDLAGLLPWCGTVLGDPPWSPILYAPVHWSCIPEGLRAQ